MFGYIWGRFQADLLLELLDHTRAFYFVLDSWHLRAANLAAAHGTAVRPGLPRTHTHHEQKQI